MLSNTQLNLCKLRLSQKFYIIKTFNDPNLLNRKSEFVNACRHQGTVLKGIDAVRKATQWIDILTYYSGPV